MPVIKSYLYSNRFTVQILDDDPTIKTRNRVVYQRPIEIYRGCDNPIIIQFKNQDQKAANIAGASFTAYVIDYPDGNVVANLSVTVSNVTAALGNVTLTESFVASLPQNKYKFALSKNVSGTTYPVYSDDNFGVNAELNINPAYNQE